MSSAPRARKKPKDAYHHGDLRLALLTAARREVARDRVASLSLKSIATSLGVSVAAPYRHFADREALLAAVATAGFRDFVAALVAAGDDVHAMGEAYLAFGRAQTGVYRLMFVSRLVPTSEEDSELGATAQESYQLLLRAVALRMGGRDAEPVARTYWATLHGLVLLEADGFFGDPTEAAASSVQLLALASDAAKAHFETTK